MDKGASNSQGASVNNGQGGPGAIPGHTDSYDMDGLRNPALTCAL